ncbi:MAG: hypothetical protein AABY46_06380 [Nitrospirota bacterium]
MENCKYDGCIWGLGHEGAHATQAQHDAANRRRRVNPMWLRHDERAYLKANPGRCVKEDCGHLRAFHVELQGTMWPVECIIPGCKCVMDWIREDDFKVVEKVA